MTNISYARIEAARAGVDPSFICRVSSGWVFLCGMQFLRGYCILQADPVVESINSLKLIQRAEFLCDMALVGDAILEVTGAYRMNYAIMGNSEPVLHAHIVPRYLSEPDDLRKGLPWSYPNAYDDTAAFNPERDKELIDQLCMSIQRRINTSPV
jgi:diadenosine tetraphosphate (Ap4A) HIT family hydrolase